MSSPQEQSHPEAGASPDALSALANELKTHISLCGEILAVVQQEHQKLKELLVDHLHLLMVTVLEEGELVERLLHGRKVVMDHLHL